MRKIFFYKSKSGISPVKNFLDNLAIPEVRKILWVMRLVEEMRYPPAEYFKKLIDDIWEIRVQLGSNSYRILGFYAAENKFIATNAFRKKQQKTPIREIDLAIKRKKIYLTEVHNE